MSPGFGIRGGLRITTPLGRLQRNIFFRPRLAQWVPIILHYRRHLVPCNANPVKYFVWLTSIASMALIVQKYGGTSVGSPERIRHVAQRVARFTAQGHRIVVVVSAMSGETNRLITLAKSVSPNPDPRELDVMVSTGEQVSI